MAYFEHHTILWAGDRSSGTSSILTTTWCLLPSLRALRQISDQTLLKGWPFLALFAPPPIVSWAWFSRRDYAGRDKTLTSHTAIKRGRCKKQNPTPPKTNTSLNHGATNLRSTPPLETMLP